MPLLRGGLLRDARGGIRALLSLPLVRRFRARLESMPSAKLTSKGQITMPKVIREVLRVQPGDRIEFTTRVGGEVVVRARTTSLRKLYGALKKRGQRRVSLAAMNRAILQAHGKPRP